MRANVNRLQNDLLIPHAIINPIKFKHFKLSTIAILNWAGSLKRKKIYEARNNEYYIVALVETFSRLYHVEI